MAAERFSAGTIFLQVAPSYDGVMESIREQAKKAGRAWDDGVEEGGGKKSPKLPGKEEGGKAGKEAGEEYAGRFRESMKRSMARTQKELKALKIDVDDSEVQSKVDKVARRLEKLKKVEIGVDLTSKEAVEEMLALEAQLEAISKLAGNIEVKANTKSASNDIAGLRRDLEKLFFTVQERNPGKFARDMHARVRAAINALPEIELKADSSDVDRELAGVYADLLRLSDIEIDVDMTAAEFKAKAAEIERQVNALDRKGVDINVRADTAAARAELASLGATSHQAGNDANNSATSFRALSGVLLTLAVVGPAVIPILLAIGGALAVITAGAIAAGAGLGVMILGLSGIGGALKAMGEAESDGGKQALAQAKTIRNASKSVASAERSLAKARDSAGRQSAAAAKRVEEATTSAARAQEQAVRRVQAAERDHAEAQRDFARAQDNLVEARQRAQDQLEDLALRARGGHLAERQAVLDLAEATAEYQAGLADGATTNAEREQQSITLERARLQLESLRLENGRLAEEQAEVARTGVEGTEAVVSAREGVANAQQREADAALGLRDAQSELTRAQIDGARSISDAVAARDQAAADGAASIRDAQLALADAQLNHSEALNQSTASAEKLAEAMAKLSPAGQRFAEFLFGLRGFFDEIRKVAQEGMLPGLQTMLEGLIGRYGPGLVRFVDTMSRTLGDLFIKIGQVLQGPAFAQFFATMAQFAPIITSLFGEVLIHFMEAFAAVMTAIMPLVPPFLTAIRDVLIEFAAWASTPEGREAILAFFTKMIDFLPAVLRFFWELGRALFNLFEALGPYAGPLIELFTDILEFIAEMDPKVLGAIAIAIIGVVIAFQTFFGIFSLLQSLALIYAFPVLFGIIAAVVAVGIALILLWRRSETFRDIVGGAFRVVGEVIGWVYDNVIKPVANAIWETFKWLGNVLAVVFEIIFLAFKQVFIWIAEYWEEFKNSGVGEKIVWFFQKIADGIKWIFEFLWNDITSLFKGGVKLVVSVINEGLVDPINWLAEAVGAEGRIKRVPTPFAEKSSTNTRATGAGRGGNIPMFAAGGRVPGYSPSPTADNIPAMLTAGEYVLPVNAVQALRAKYGDQFLEMLRHGLPGFAKGGLVEFGRMLQGMGARVAEHPAFGGVRGKHATNSKHYSGQAIDVNTRPGTSALEQRELARFVEMAKDYGLRSIFMTTGHYGHAHFDTGKGGSMVGKVVGGVLGAVKDAAGSVVGAPLSYLMGKVRDSGPFKEIEKLGNFGKIMLGGVARVVDMGVDWLVDKTGAVGDFFTDRGDEGEKAKFAGGGPVLYDSGGFIPPGLSTVLNATGRPEPVFTGDEFDRLVDGGGRGGDTFNLKAISNANPEDIAQAWIFAQRQLRRGGVYTGGRTA